LFWHQYGARKLVILRKPVAKLKESALARFVTKACKAAKVKGSVNVVVTNSQEMRSLNRRFRGKDKATDVLSFPPIADFADGLAGDVAISQDIAIKNARAIGHAPAEEVKILALHGVLHLAGFDHESDNGEMAREENRLRRKLGLPVGLIERSGKASARKR
jgi:probable rRNA maturation factor